MGGGAAQMKPRWPVNFQKQIDRELEKLDPRPMTAGKAALLRLDPPEQIPPVAPPDDDRLNKLERRYRDYLEGRKRAGEIVEYVVHPGSLRLGFNNRYEPDFLVQFPRHVEIHDTKGYMQEDSYEKIKNAAERFWIFRFVVVTWSKSAGWEYREIGRKK